MVAAELASELLAQEFLRPRGSAVDWLPVRLNLRSHTPSRFFLQRRDEALLAHPDQHDVAPLERALIV